MERYYRDEAKINREFQSIKDRLSKHNYATDELKLAKYENQTEKCKRDVQSLVKRLKSAQGANLLMAREKVEMRKADCATIEKNMETTKLLLVGRDKLLRRQKELENKLATVKGKIKHYEVMCIY